MSEYNGILYLAPPPEGVIPDFNNSHNAQSLIVSIAVLLPLAIFFTGLRSVTRLWLTKQHGEDDGEHLQKRELAHKVANSVVVVMVVATALSIVLCAIIFDSITLAFQFRWKRPI